MKLLVKTSIVLFLVVLFSVSLILLYQRMWDIKYLTFSDGAKFAVIARNISEGRGFVSDFSFYSASLLTRTSDLFSAAGVPYLVPLIISILFRFFGVSDFSVILFSGTFYVLLVLVVFLLARILYGNLVGALSAIAVAASQSFLNYATSGASEMLYTFLAVAATYLVYVRKWFTDLIFFVSLILIYLTKPQGIVLIGVLLLLWFLTRFSWKKGLTFFSILTFGIYAFDKLVLLPLSSKYPVYPIVTRGLQALLQYSPSAAVSDALRGQPADVVGLMEILKKTFYNLYNFYKLLPDIASPYLWTLAIIGLFIRFKEKNRNYFSLLTILATLGTFLLASLTIPFYRYLHPVIPFVYILASAALVWILEKISTNNRFISLSSIFLIVTFSVGQALGAILLDSRFERNMYNVGKPPVYVELSRILKDNTDENQVVVTNLDTWGSWYGERKTVWFPLEPKQLIGGNLPFGKQIPFDAIYLTSYLIDDENYYMGSDWKKIFDNPEDMTKWDCSGCGVISKEFTLKEVYKIESEENYERYVATAVLLVKK